MKLMRLKIQPKTPSIREGSRPIVFTTICMKKRAVESQVSIKISVS